MNEKPLDAAELELLEMISQIHAEKGPFLRSTLSVIGRGQGLEVTRSFNRLKALGLVEEVERRPFFLLRLFGAKSTFLLRPKGEVFSAPEPLNSGEAVSEAPVAEVPVAEVAAAAAVVAPEIVAEPVAAKPEGAKPKAAKPKPAKPARLPLDAYTDEIGGQPLAYAPMPFAAALDPDLLEGMRETLAVLGMEMTVAGEVLLGERMARGMSGGEALAQVAVYAFAHAAHHDLLDGGQMDADVLREFAAEVIRELDKLRGGGEISDAAFDRDRAAIAVLADTAADRAKLVVDLLSDPVGGAAPPALLPEDLRGVGVYGD